MSLLSALLMLKIGLKIVARLPVVRTLISLSVQRVLSFALIVALLTVGLAVMLWLIFGNQLLSCAWIVGALAEIVKCYLGNWSLADWYKVDETTTNVVVAIVTLLSVFIMPNVAVAIYVAAFKIIRETKIASEKNKTQAGVVVNVDAIDRKHKRSHKKNYEREVLKSLGRKVLMQVSFSGSEKVFPRIAYSTPPSSWVKFL